MEKWTGGIDGIMAKIDKMIVMEIAPDTYAINECGMAAMYLLIGKERALLIDTGAGTLDLKGFVETMTTLPYDVVLTHAHTDHTGAAPQFSSVYLHESEWDALRKIDYNKAEEYARAIGEAGAFEVFGYRPDDVIRYEGTPETKPLLEGMVFALGDRDVEVIETPGHTRGSCSLLDRKNRILFSGDACNENLLICDGDAAVLYETLVKLKMLEEAFDRNYSGHLGYAGNFMHRSQPYGVLDDALYICEKMLHGRADMQDEENALNHKIVQYMRHGTVKITLM